jgi:hypothetical protein
MASGLYFYIWGSLSKVTIERQDDRPAWFGFRMWWIALALSTLLPALTTILAVANVTSLALHVGISLLSILLISLALWGLLFYLLYIYSGRSGLRWLLAFGYLVFFAVLVTWTLNSNPSGVELDMWSATIVYEQPPTGAFVLALLVALIIPPVLACGGLVLLIFRVDDRSAKYRLAALSFSLIIWFGISFLAALLGMSEIAWWPLASRVIGLVAALAIFFGYFPPATVQRRLQIKTIEG